MIRSTSALQLTAVVLVALVLIAWFARRPRHPRDGYCAGPYNMQLYDSPYKYPYYEGLETMDWDGDARCVAYCATSPCTVWCR